MAYGAYSVYVTCRGPRGTGTAIVPVNSFATGRLPLSARIGRDSRRARGLLVAGFLTIVRAGAGESLVPPGEAIDAPRRQRANVVTGMAAAILALALFGGAKWWSAEDSAYRGHMFGSPRVDAVVLGGRIASNAAAQSPRHGGVSRDLLAGRARPREDDAPLPRELDGNADVRASASAADGLAGFHHGSAIGPGGSLSAVRRHHAREWAESHGDDTRRASARARSRSTPSDSDDTWDRTATVTTLARGRRPRSCRMATRWPGPATARRSRPVNRRICGSCVRDSAGAVAQRPAVSWNGRARRRRSDDDGSVFIHLHPMGTVTPTAQQVFALRDRGDTTQRGRLRTEELTTERHDATCRCPGS